MLAIARALMLRPRLLLMDEPSFGLAPLVVQDIFRIMRRIREGQNVAILLVEQNAALALELADTAYLLETGRIVLAGSATAVRNNDAVRSAYLGGPPGPGQPGPPPAGVQAKWQSHICSKGHAG